jgi:hypothetical protein
VYQEPRLRLLMLEIRKVFPGNADHRCGLVVDAHRAPDDVASTVETRLPGGVAYHNSGGSISPFVEGFDEHASERRAMSKLVKPIRRHVQRA